MIRTAPIARTGTLKPARTRSRKCAMKGCSGRVTAPEPFVRWCSPACGTSIALGRLAKQKTAQQRMAAREARAERVATKAKLEKFKRKPEWIAEVQTLFNKVVRIEDRDLPCISCGRHVPDDGRPGGAWDAGHYLARGGSPHLRFDRRNVHKQCKGCNRPGGTTRQAFRNGLVDRIGLVAVEALEADQAPRHYTIDELKTLKSEIAARLKHIRDQMG